MVSKKNFKPTCKALEDMGMTIVTMNKMGPVYGLGNVTMPVAFDINDHNARHVIHNARKLLGIPTLKDAKKRDAENVRQRQAQERERLAQQIARHAEEIQRLVVQREARLDGLGRVLTSAEMSAIERLIEQKQREMRGWESLMTAIPGPRADANRPRAKHRS